MLLGCITSVSISCYRAFFHSLPSTGVKQWRLYEVSLSFFFSFRLHLATCRIFIPQPGVEPWAWQWKPQVLTTGLPGNSLNSVFYLKSKPQVLDNFLALRYFSNKYQYLLNSHSRCHQPEMNDAVSCTLCPSCSALAKNAFPDLFLRK